MVLNLVADVISATLNPLLSDPAMQTIHPAEGRVNTTKQRFRFVHMMKIQALSALYENQIEKVESTVFEVSGCKWKLNLYPSGKCNPKNHVSLFVDIEDLPPNWVVNATLRLFALHLLEEKWKIIDCRACFSSCNTTCGLENFLSIGELFDQRNGYVWNDVAVFGVEIVRNQCNIPRAIGTAESLTMVKRPANGKFTWKITKFSSFIQPKHFSHAFIVAQRKWRIEMYPKGTLDQKGNGMSVFLTAFEHVGNAPKAKTYAKAKLRVLDQLYSEHREKTISYWFSNPGLGYGFYDFITHKDLRDESKGFLMNDLMYIGVEFEVVSFTA